MARDLEPVSVTSLAGWFPFRVSLDDAGEIAVDWFRLGEMRLSDDRFFADSVSRAARHPFNLVFRRRTGVADLDAVARDGREPDGLIFHLSRCGSTLAAQMLGAEPGVLTISEPGPINDVVALPEHALSYDRRVELLRAIARALSASSGTSHERYVIKLDAWHARSIALFERAFPDTPWVYLYRDPLEVMVSHLMTPSFMMSAANARATLDLPVTEAVRLSHAERSIATLAAIGAAVLDREPDARHLVAYDEIADAIPTRVAPAFGITLAAEGRARMDAVRAFHAKQPGTLYVDDRDAKRNAASPDLRAIVDARLRPIHDSLEARRSR